MMARSSNLTNKPEKKTYTQPAFNSTTNKFRIINFRLTKTSDRVCIPMCKLQTFSGSLEYIRVPFYSGIYPTKQTHIAKMAKGLPHTADVGAIFSIFKWLFAGRA